MIEDNLKHFTVSSDKLYDKHKYKVYFKDGTSVIYEDYETMKYIWYQNREQVDHVDVVDKGGKGF